MLVQISFQLNLRSISYPTMWNPMYEKCGKVVGITMQIMLLSNCEKTLSKAFQHCGKWVLLESYAKILVILCCYYWKSVRIWCKFYLKTLAIFVLLLLEKCKNLNLKYIAITNENKMISITEKPHWVPLYRGWSLRTIVQPWHYKSKRAWQHFS